MNKRGEILIIAIILIALLVLVWLAIVLIEYFQINNILSDIKSSLFYICQNAMLSYDTNLSLDVYNIDTIKLRNVISDLIYKNHIEGKHKVDGIDIEELYLVINEAECIEHSKNMQNLPFIHIVVKVKFTPIVKLDGQDVKSFEIHQDIKLALMKY